MDLHHTLYPIADTLYVALHTQKGQSYVRGDSKAPQFYVRQTDFPYSVEVVLGCYDETSAAVLARVCEDLYLFCRYWPGNRTMEIKLVDRKKLLIQPRKMKTVARVLDLEAYADRGMVAHFMRKGLNGAWKPVHSR